ncbi:hypothetical protein PR048_026354 [Dryococelus australis]|uniref:PH domain-containing protein n=1 Tax=Dryococelus australis TaxID=614101 RepID=A0ABQ9GL65_9NEOP|nr:hypothetical protein PR048_026354 [Dryococelus australis]
MGEAESKEVAKEWLTAVMSLVGKCMEIEIDISSTTGLLDINDQRLRKSKAGKESATIRITKPSQYSLGVISENRGNETRTARLAIKPGGPVGSHYTTLVSVMKITNWSHILPLRGDISCLVEQILPWYLVVVKHEEPIVCAIQANLLSKVTNYDSWIGGLKQGLSLTYHQTVAARRQTRGRSGAADFETSASSLLHHLQGDDIVPMIVLPTIGFVDVPSIGCVNNPDRCTCFSVVKVYMERQENEENNNQEGALQRCTEGDTKDECCILILYGVVHNGAYYVPQLMAHLSLNVNTVSANFVTSRPTNMLTRPFGRDWKKVCWFEEARLSPHQANWQVWVRSIKRTEKKSKITEDFGMLPNSLSNYLKTMIKF